MREATEVCLCADHGLYAHQTPTFDSYTASHEFPMHITEHSSSSSYKLVGEVAGVLKMTGKAGRALNPDMMVVHETNRFACQAHVACCLSSR